MIYCIDSSSLIGAFVRHYPHHAFPGFWREFELLIKAGRVFAPREVFGELSVRKDPLATWAKNHPDMFIQSNYYVLTKVGNIGIDYPATVTTTIAGGKADPYLVAMADHKKWTVVSEESGSSTVIPTIPQMCKKYTVPCMKLLEVITGEGWSFR